MEFRDEQEMKDTLCLYSMFSMPIYAHDSTKLLWF